MTYVILCLTLLAIGAILYSRFRSKQATKLEQVHNVLEAQIDQTKKEVLAIEKEVQDASTNYNTVYDAYRRKYSISPRADDTTPGNIPGSSDCQ